MTTLKDRPNTALLVIDVQTGVVAGAHERDAVVANVGSLVEKARRERVPVVWVQHSDEGLAKGSDNWRIVPELVPGKAVQQLKRESGKGLFMGGVKLPQALAELGLIDEYEFIVQPRLAGHGPTLFAGLSKYVDLKLVSRLEFGSGAVAMRYEPRR